MQAREARVRCEAEGAEFRLRRLSGREELSRLYRYDLLLESTNIDLKLATLLGTKLGVELDTYGGSKRYFHGYVADAVYLGTDQDKALYHVAIVPWFWFLDRGGDSRIFQKKTVVQIVEDVFGRHSSIADFTKRRLGDYKERDYCVQYRESDFNFISRLLEDEGIYYFFDHSASAHTLVLIDDAGSHEAHENYQTVRFYPPDDHHRRERDHLNGWRHTARVRPGKSTLRDYDFEKPSTDLTAEDNAPKEHQLAQEEVYDFPGGYVQLDHGDTRARVRLEELQADQERGEGEGNAAGLCCGCKFKLEGSPRTDQNIDYLLVAVDSTIEVEATRSAGGMVDDPYHCRIETLDIKKPFRTLRTTRKPFVHGPQTAMVTGPAGEEIYTDKYGRVKVQFHWDRQGKRDENSSCWVRVSQAWAGAGYGSIHIPRIGQEVVIDFLEGDPDQPIITGRVYNAQQMPPYGLPGGAVNSGIKSNSTKGGGGSNELKFDDTKGKELVYFHAQYDHTGDVEHDETWHVKNNRTETVDVNETLTVHGTRTRTVDGDETVTLNSNLSQTVASNETFTTGSNRSYTVGGNETLSVGGKQTMSVGSTQEESIATSRTLSVGSSEEVSIGTGATLTVGTSRNVSAGTSYNLEAPKIELTGQASITLTVGGSFVKIDPSGVTIVGPMVKLN